MGLGFMWIALGVLCPAALSPNLQGSTEGATEVVLWVCIPAGPAQGIGMHCSTLVCNALISRVCMPCVTMACCSSSPGASNAS